MLGKQGISRKLENGYRVSLRRQGARKNRCLGVTGDDHGVACTGSWGIVLGGRGKREKERERGLARDGRRGYLFWLEAGHGRFVSLCVMGTGGWKRHKTACASRLRQLSQGIPCPTSPRRHADWLRAGLVPQNGSSRALCGTPTDGSPQSPSREGAVVVPWDRQRGAQRRVDGPRSRLPGLPSKTRNWFNQTVCRQGSKLSLVRALASPVQPSCSHQQPGPHNGCSSLASARLGCQPAHCGGGSGGTWAASTGMIAAGHASHWSSGWETANSQPISAVWFVRAPVLILRSAHRAPTDGNSSVGR